MLTPVTATVYFVDLLAAIRSASGISLSGIYNGFLRVPII